MTETAQSILVVEDVPHVADMLRYLLESEGHAVHIASDAASARAALDALPPAALVLLDAVLPDGDGIDLLPALRAGAWAHVPVLMLSARSDEEDIVRALAAGASDYLIKPFQPWELLERVRKLLAP